MKIYIFYLNIIPNYLLTVPILTYCNLKIHWRYLKVLRQIQITMLLYLQYSSLFNYNVKSNYNVTLENSKYTTNKPSIMQAEKKSIQKKNKKHAQDETKTKNEKKNRTAKICAEICPWTLFVPQSSSFPCTKFSENCLLFRTDNVCRQTSVHISVPDGGYCLFIGSFWTLYQRQGLISMPGKTLIRTCFSKGIVVDHRVEKKKLKSWRPTFFLDSHL